MATAGKFSKGSSAKEEALKTDTKADTKADKSDPTVPEPKKTEAKDPEPKKGDTDTEAKTAEEDPGSGSPQDALNEALEDVLQDPGEAESYQQEPTAYDVDEEWVVVEEADDDTNNDVPEEDTGNEEFGGGSPEDNAIIAESLNSGESSDGDGVAVDGEIAEDDFVPVEEGAPAEEEIVEDFGEGSDNSGFGSGDVHIEDSNDVHIEDSNDVVAIEEDIVEAKEPDTEEDDSGMPSLAGATVSGFFDTSHLTDVDSSLSDSIVDDDLFDA